MDKNEQILKIDELKTAMHKHDFEKAVEIADTLDLKKMKDNNFLSLVADAYELTHNYMEAKKVLLLAYENTNAGRHLAYRLCLIAIKTKEYEEAQEFYEDFVEMAPRDTSRYVLKYKMAKAKNAPIENLIEILEEYVNIDMEEKWAYELAKLYHMAGDEEKCVDMCDEISLWFAEGKYVVKAMELKKMYRSLTAAQQKNYEESKKKSEDEVAKAAVEKVTEEAEKASEQEQVENIEEIPEISIPTSEDSAFNTMDIQEVIAKGMEEIEIEEGENIHEDATATKIAPSFVQEEPKEESKVEPKEGPQEEPQVDKIDDIKNVEDILRQLQARGILKADTVEKAVNIIDEAIVDEESQGSVAESDKQDSIEEVDNEDAIDKANEEEAIEEVVAEETIDTEEKIENTTEVKLPIEEEKSEEVVAEEGQQPEETEKEETVQQDIKQPKTKDGVPVFDLDFETPIVTKEEQTDLAEDELPKTEIKSSKDISAKVEIISGTDWEQPNVPEQKVDEDKESTESEPTSETEESQPESEKEEIEIEPGFQLTEEDLTPFKNYLNVEGLESNIKEVVQTLINDYNPNGKSAEGNIMIMGDKETGKTTLAIEIIKLVNRKRGRLNRRLAKIDAAALNRRGFRNSLNKLLGSDLIIENAHDLGAMTLSEIVDASGMFTDDMLIILEGETKLLEKQRSNSQRLNEVFNLVIKIKEYDIKEWVEYGIRYAKTKDYTLDEVANLAFYKAIDDFFGKNKGIGQSDVESIIDDAIARSKGIKRKLSGIFSSKKDEDGLYILVESDFNI